MVNKKAVITVRVELDILNYIRKMAKEWDLDKSEVTRLFIKEGIANQYRNPKLITAWQMERDYSLIKDFIKLKGGLFK